MSFFGIDVWSDNFGTRGTLEVGLRGNGLRRPRRPTVKSEEDQAECEEVCSNGTHSADGRSNGSHRLVRERLVIRDSALLWLFHLPESGIRAKSQRDFFP
jgi:hypothetical protein